MGIEARDLLETPRYVSTEPAQAFDLSVGIFAAPLAHRSARPQVRSPEEVASVFWLPRRALGRPERTLRSTRSGPRMVEATLYEGHVLWGFTRRVLMEFFGADGREPT